MDQNKIGKFIAESRRIKNMTQEELACKLNVTDRAISKWECGRGLPDVSILEDLSNNLGITVNELLRGEKIENENIVKEYDENIVNILKEYKKMKKVKNILKIILVILLVVIIRMFIVIYTPYILSGFSKIEVYEDVDNYNNYFGSNADDAFKNKWDMDEAIFPSKITDDMSIADFKMVYYNPWDAQYLSYLEVLYDNSEYQKEVDRLKKYKSTKYLGYYGVTGFNDNYELLAIYADSYNGFVYALTNNKNKIIYVELIFCNYFMDIDYKKYIKDEYLPLGFDASINNSYRKKMLKNK